MKKLSFIISTLLLLATLTACDSNGVQNDENPSSDTEQTEIFAEKTLEFFNGKTIGIPGNVDDTSSYTDETKIGNLWFSNHIYCDYTDSRTDDMYFLVAINVHDNKSKGRVYIKDELEKYLKEKYPNKAEYTNEEYLEAVKAANNPENEYWQRYYDDLLSYYENMTEYDKKTSDDPSSYKVAAELDKLDLKKTDVEVAKSIFTGFGIPVYSDGFLAERNPDNYYAYGDFYVIANKEDFEKVNSEGSYIYEICESVYGIKEFFNDYTEDNTDITVVKERLVSNLN